MARAGVPVDETVDCPGWTAERVADHLLAVGGTRYRGVNVGAGRFQFARSYRPTWATVAFVIGLPVLVGLLFLLIRRQEAWTATVEEDHLIVRVRLSGRVLPGVLATVQRDLGTPPHRYARPLHLPADAAAAPGVQVAPAAPPAVPATPAAPPAVPAAPAAPSATAASPPTPPPPPSSTPPPPPFVDPSTAVVERPPIAVDTARRVLLCFDTGEQHPLEPGRLLLVGREPQTRPSDPAPTDLVAVDDPEHSVSRTHLAVWADGDGLWIADRASTNGTVVEDDGGERRPVPSGGEARATTGSTVRFGRRSFVVAEVPG